MTIGLAACGTEPAPVAPVRAPPPPSIEASSAPRPAPIASAELDAGSVAAPRDCPDGMQLVDTLYCPEVKLRCLKSEYEKSNHLTICHEFAPGQTCVGAPRRQRYCIDRYEFPNREGAHPPVMVSWFDAHAACEAEEKRLCRESEWVAACEGPDKLPFPYGLKRDPEQCNIDNRWVTPELTKIYSPDAKVAEDELLRLDRSVPSGAKPGCTSGFGVHDLTGNVDEWVVAESRHTKSGWAGLKGGAWGHVRNACRPMTTSHSPDFKYYFVSFRCCADAKPNDDAEKDPALWRPPPLPEHAPRAPVAKGWTPSSRAE